MFYRQQGQLLVPHELINKSVDMENNQLLGWFYVIACHYTISLLHNHLFVTFFFTNSRHRERSISHIGYGSVSNMVTTSFIFEKNCDCNEYFIDYQDYKIAVIESLQSIDLRYRSYTEPLRLTVEGQQQQVGEQFAKLKICQSMMSV